MWVTYLTPRSLFCVSFAVPLSAESSDCAALFLLRQLSLHYQYSIQLSLSSIRSLLFNSLKVSNIFNSIIIYKLPTVVEAKPSGPSCVYCWPSGWLMHNGKAQRAGHEAQWHAKYISSFKERHLRTKVLACCSNSNGKAQKDKPDANLFLLS